MLGVGLVKWWEVVEDVVAVAFLVRFEGGAVEFWREESETMKPSESLGLWVDLRLAMVGGAPVGFDLNGYGSVRYSCARL